MKWTTWENIGVDRMACAWLIRRFIDSKAKFTFVPEGQMPTPKAGEPFDIPGVRLAHHKGHCSFHTVLDEYKLSDPVLRRIARIVDEADTVQEALVETAAAGLDLICRGIRRTSADDHVALERGALIYDALYAELAAEELGNTCPSNRMSSTKESPCIRSTASHSLPSVPLSRQHRRSPPTRNSTRPRSSS